MERVGGPDCKEKGAKEKDSFSAILYGRSIALESKAKAAQKIGRKT